MKKGTKFIESILEEVRQEKGMSKREMKEFWSLHLKYIQELMDQEDTFAINFTNLGILTFNTYYTKRMSYYSSKSTKKKPEYLDLVKVEKIENMIEKDKEKGIKSIIRYVQREKPVKFKLLSQLYRKLTGGRKRYASKDRINRILEDYNYNNIDEEYFIKK